jgi:hypothetical protein
VCVSEIFQPSFAVSQEDTQMRTSVQIFCIGFL